MRSSLRRPLLFQLVEESREINEVNEKPFHVQMREEEQVSCQTTRATKREKTLRVCSDANATARVVLELGVDGISKRPKTVIT